jgi:hypothetical protein
MRILIWTTVLVLVSLACACKERPRRILKNDEMECERNLSGFRTIFTLDVDGNTADLEVWIERGYPPHEKEWLRRVAEILKPLRLLSPQGKVDLRDVWGYKLVYEKPSKDANYLYRLYSIGRNGIDEGGGGDDIDVSFRVR